MLASVCAPVQVQCNWARSATFTVLRHARLAVQLYRRWRRVNARARGLHLFLHLRLQASGAVAGDQLMTALDTNTAGMR